MRPAVVGDAEELSRAYRRNREHLRPWEPRRGEAFYTPEGQRARLREQVELAGAGRLVPWVLARDGVIVGVMTLSNVALGPFRSANLGYWVDAGHVGRGLATAGVRLVCRTADEVLGLHRIEAGTLIENAASQRVLDKCGFERIGVARDYLHIDGRWRDHVLFQRILNRRAPG
ncbi:GNAT family N-acetyltransferase [Allostreptomyces psammosilenae]|nr:GNAT family N-acetyltransferase [Allostreptomyces psammosilenae]